MTFDVEASGIPGIVQGHAITANLDLHRGLVEELRCRFFLSGDAGFCPWCLGGPRITGGCSWEAISTSSDVMDYGCDRVGRAVLQQWSI